MKNIYNEANELLLLIRATIAANVDNRTKEIGDRVVIWDGSGNKDKNTGEERCGIDPLFTNNKAIVIQTGCEEYSHDELLNRVTEKNCDKLLDLLLKFPSGEEVYCSSQFVRIEE